MAGAKDVEGRAPDQEVEEVLRNSRDQLLLDVAEQRFEIADVRPRWDRAAELPPSQHLEHQTEMDAPSLRQTPDFLEFLLAHPRSETPDRRIAELEEGEGQVLAVDDRREPLLLEPANVEGRDHAGGEDEPEPPLRVRGQQGDEPTDLRVRIDILPVVHDHPGGGALGFLEEEAEFLGGLRGRHAPRHGLLLNARLAKRRHCLRERLDEVADESPRIVVARVEVEPRPACGRHLLEELQRQDRLSISSRRDEQDQIGAAAREFAGEPGALDEMRHPRWGRNLRGEVSHRATSVFLRKSLINSNVDG